MMLFAEPNRRQLVDEQNDGTVLKGCVEERDLPPPQILYALDGT